MVRNQPNEGEQPRGEDPRSLREQATRTREQAEEASRKAADRVGEGARQVKDQLSGAAEQIRQKSQSAAEQQKNLAAKKLHDCSTALRQAGEKLHQEQDDMIARYCDTAADQLDRAAGYIENRDIRSVMRDVQNVARQQPELVIGGALLAGLVIARFIKASAAERQEEQYIGGQSSFAHRSPDVPERHQVPAAVPLTATGGFSEPRQQPYEATGGARPPSHEEFGQQRTQSQPPENL